MKIKTYVKYSVLSVPLHPLHSTVNLQAHKMKYLDLLQEHFSIFKQLDIKPTNKVIDIVNALERFEINNAGKSLDSEDILLVNFLKKLWVLTKIQSFVISRIKSS